MNKNILFVFGMPFDIESKSKNIKNTFKNCEVKYYLTNYINRWSCNNIESLSENKNYLLNYNIDFVDNKIYDKNLLLELYNKYYPDFYKLLLDIFNENEVDYESEHYFSRLQETINDYVYFKEIIENEDIENYNKIIFMSLNMEFIEDEFDFTSCYNDSIINFINVTDEFYTNRILRKKDLLYFDYDFINLAWNFWWTDILNFKKIVNKLNNDLLFIYNKMKIDNKVPIVDTEIARGYILNKYIKNKGPIFIKKSKPNFDFLENDKTEKFKKVQKI